MAYTPLNWQSGDIVTAEKLNQMKGGVLFIRPTYTPIGDNVVRVSLGYSYQDIMAMLDSNVLPIVIGEADDELWLAFFSSANTSDSTYTVQFSENYSAETETDILFYEYNDEPDPGPI